MDVSQLAGMVSLIYMCNC